MAGQRRLASRFVRQPRTQGGKWAFTVVVGHPRRQDPPQTPLVERNQPIETLVPGRLNESLAVAVALWRDDGEYDASSPSRTRRRQWRLPDPVSSDLLGPPTSWRNRDVMAIAQLAEPAAGEPEFLGERIERCRPIVVVELLAGE